MEGLAVGYGLGVTTSYVPAAFATFLTRQAYHAFARHDTVREAVVDALARVDAVPNPTADGIAAARESVERFKRGAETAVQRIAMRFDNMPEPNDSRTAIGVIADLMTEMESFVHDAVLEVMPEMIANFNEDDGPAVARVIEHLLAPPLLPLGLNAMVTSLVACFERSIGNVLLVDVGLRGPQMWDDVARAAAKAAYHRKWIDHLARRGIDVRRLTPCWSDFEEVLARRNAIVHNGGKVDEKYRNCVSAEAADGEDLSIDVAYVERASDQLAALAMLVSASLHPDPEVATGELTNLALYLLHLGQPRRAELLLTGAADLYQRCGDDNQVAEWRVNVALARKLQSGTEAIADEVMAWNLPERPLFALARDVLLDRPVTADRLAGLVDDGVMSWGDIRTWPLFSDLRRTRRFANCSKPPALVEVPGATVGPRRPATASRGAAM